jgi:uncharacterized membrane protein
MEDSVIAGLIAFLMSALFTGAAVYVSFVEQPARLMLEDKPALEQFKPAYRAGAAMQGSLALLGFLFGLLAWWQTKSSLILAGAVLQLLPWPWTLLVIMPVNRALLAIDPAQAGARSRVLMEQWGGLHMVRTGLGAAAVLALGCGLFDSLEPGP